MKTIIHTPTPNIDQSLDFYKKLNFAVLSATDHLLTDGNAIFEINEDRHARAGLKLLKSSWKEEVDKLEDITTVLPIEKGYLLSDTSGVWIYLIEQEEELQYDLEDIPLSVLGNFAGISLEAVDMERSLAIYEILDFTKTMGDIEQGWIGLTNHDNFTVSLMKPNSCPHLFFNPSITYFNGKSNPVIIHKIRELDLPITEEITAFNEEGIVDNIIIRDPGGYGFFIFND